MYQNLIIIGFTLLADIYYYFTYTNRLVTKFFESYIKGTEDVFVKKVTMEDENGESMEAELHANTPSDSETLLNIVVDSNSNKPIKFNYNSAEIMTLLWYGNGELIRNGKCYNKDFTVLLLLSIITDLNREGKIELGKYNIYDKPLIFCIDKNAVGIPYYDFCLDLFKEKKLYAITCFY